jgi:hypothetical protein
VPTVAHFGRADRFYPERVTKRNLFVLRREILCPKKFEIKKGHTNSRRPLFCILAHRPCVDADGSKLRRQFVSSTSTATTTNYLA